MENFADKITQEMKTFGDRLARYETEYASISTRPDVEASVSLCLALLGFCVS